jgi:hypothetical protein
MPDAPSEIHPQVEGWVSDFKARFMLLRSQYDHAYVAGGYSILESGYKLVQAVLAPLHGGKPENESRQNYASFVLFRKRLSPDQFWETFESLVRTGDLNVPDIGILPFKGRLGPLSKFPAAAYPFHARWPLTVAQVSADNDGRITHVKLSSPDSELYPGPQDALEQWTGVTPGWSGFSPVVYAALPDYRAKITSVEIGPERVKVRARTGIPQTGDLRIRYYASSPDHLPVHGSARVKGGAANCQLGFVPTKLLVDLYARAISEALDWREYDAQRMSLAGDVRFKVPRENLRNLILGGESTFVEFKKVLPTPEFEESVCAFANTHGGTIIVGVKDDASIQGFKHPKYGPSYVDSIIRANLHPVPAYQVRQTELDLKPLMIIEVPEGLAKPYCVRDRGTYVRANASDRHANKEELLDLCRGPTRR